MKAEHLNPFISATLNTFRTMLGMDPKRGELYVKNSKSQVYYDISGVIGLAGDVIGFVTVCFPEDLGLKVTGAFFGEDIEEMGPDVSDTIGEITNMIAGGAKKILAEDGYKFNISVPNVVVGHHHFVDRPSSVMCIGVRFQMEGSDFAIEVALEDPADS